MGKRKFSNFYNKVGIGVILDFIKEDLGTDLPQEAIQFFSVDEKTGFFHFVDPQSGSEQSFIVQRGFSKNKQYDDRVWFKFRSPNRTLYFSVIVLEKDNAHLTALRGCVPSFKPC